MIDSRRAREIVLAASIEDECQEHMAALSAVGPDDDDGALPALAAWEIFSHRAEKGKAAGVDVRGIDRVVERLAALPADERVLLFLFENTTRDYTIFIVERDESFIGCISVPRRPRRVAPPGWDGLTKFWQDDEGA